MRVVSWNVNWRTGVARAQGELVRDLRPDLVILQEVNPSSAERLWEATELKWMIQSDPPAGSTEPRRRRVVAVCGTEAFSSWQLDLEAPVRERVLAVDIEHQGWRGTVISYYAPPGVSWGITKVAQAQAVTDWICAREGPVILGADANTPKLDPVDDAAVRTHWHTGFRKLNGGPGDDELWGPSPRHQLRDCLRVWLAADPSRARDIDPDGPLAVSHYTAKRRNHPGNPRRFDAIWTTADFTVTDVRYLSEELGRLSDHAPVVVDLDCHHLSDGLGHDSSNV
jgi:exonuclease III